MGELTREEVERIARLAGLRLSDDEIGALAGEMASILEHFEAIRRREEGAAGPRAREPGGGAPGEAGPAGSGLRPDEVDPDPLRRPPSALAPDWREGHFVVPRLAALGGGGRAPDGGASGDGAPDGGPPGEGTDGSG